MAHVYWSQSVYICTVDDVWLLMSGYSDKCEFDYRIRKDWVFCRTGPIRWHSRATTWRVGLKRNALQLRARGICLISALMPASSGIAAPPLRPVRHRSRSTSAPGRQTRQIWRYVLWYTTVRLSKSECCESISSFILKECSLLKRVNLMDFPSTDHNFVCFERVFALRVVHISLRESRLCGPLWDREGLKVLYYL